LDFRSNAGMIFSFSFCDWDNEREKQNSDSNKRFFINTLLMVS